MAQLKDTIVNGNLNVTDSISVSNDLTVSYKLTVGDNIVNDNYSLYVGGNCHVKNNLSVDEGITGNTIQGNIVKCSTAPTADTDVVILGGFKGNGKEYFINGSCIAVNASLSYTGGKFNLSLGDNFIYSFNK